MIKCPRDLSGVIFSIEVVRRLRTDLNDRQIVASLEKADSGDVRVWMESHFERAPFPPAPTRTLNDGRGGTFIAATSGAQLCRWAREFDNCARTRLLQAVKGASVFYRYDVSGERIAFIELRRVGNVGWAIAEMAGPRNDELPVSVKLRIASVFEKAGVMTVPQAIDERRWVGIE